MGLPQAECEAPSAASQRGLVRVGEASRPTGTPEAWGEAPSARARVNPSRPAIFLRVARTDQAAVF